MSIEIYPYILEGDQSVDLIEGYDVVTVDSYDVVFEEEQTLGGIDLVG